MNLKMKFAKEVILNKKGLNHLKIKVTPPTPKQMGKKKPVCIVFALDRSGSMSDLAGEPPRLGQSTPVYPNLFAPIQPSSSFSSPSYPILYNISERSTKMGFAQDSIIKFLDLLGSKDMVGVVSFDDIAIVEQEPTHIKDNKVKDSVIARVRSIQPRGCTNISDALVTAGKMFSEEILSEYNCKIILLSDGIANKGVTDVDGLTSIALDCAKKGIAISSLGVGLYYNSATMGEIARSGNGLFHYINNLSKLESVFAQELKLSSSVTAKDVKVMLEIPSLIEIGENLNGYTQEVVDGNVLIHLGDMYGTRRIVIEIRNDFVDEDVRFSVKAIYKDLDDNERSVKTSALLKVVRDEELLKDYKEDKELIGYVLSLIKSAAIEKSSAMYEHGDLESLEGVMSSTTAIIRGISQSYTTSHSSASSALSSLDEVGALYASNSVSSDQVKEMYATSHQARRS